MSTPAIQRPVTVWVTTDTHWNHTKMIRSGFRPEDYEARIRENWNKMIKPMDIVFHLGDVICGREGDLSQILENLNGTKILVRGNHDQGRSVSWYIDHGFSAVMDSIGVNGIYLTHEPAKFLPDGHYLNIHGHLHNSDHRTADYNLKPWHILIALEANDYMPVDLSVLATKHQELKRSIRS